MIPFLFLIWPENFLVSFAFSLAPSLLIFSYCHSRVATRVFFFIYPIFFWFLPSFPFLLHIFFPFPSFLLWCPFSFPFFSPFPCFFLLPPTFLAPLLDPPGCKRTLCTPRIRHCKLWHHIHFWSRIKFRSTQYYTQLPCWLFSTHMICIHCIRLSQT